MRVFVTNLTVTRAGAPILLGVGEDGSETFAVRVGGFGYHVLIEPPSSKSASEVASRAWAAAALFERGLVPRARATFVNKTRLCYRGPPIWLVSVSLANQREIDDCVRGLAKARVGTVHHGRIDLETRFMIATGVRCFTWIDFGTCTRITSSCQTRCDVEVTAHVSVISNEGASDPAPPLRCMAFDMETDGLDPHADEVRMISALLDNHAPVLFSRYPIERDDDDADYDLRVYESEADLLAAFCAYVASSRVVFLTGWNVYGFDMRFLYERSRRTPISAAAFQALSWTCTPVVPTQKTMESAAFGHNDVFDDRLVGLIVLDGYLIARKSLQLESYSLSTMAKRIGKAKGDVSYQDMLRAFTTADACLLRDVASYCVNDTVLVPAILESIEQPANTMAMATLTCSTPAQVLKRGQSILIYNLILAESIPSGYVVNAPPRPERGATIDTHYEGALVLEPVRGLYDVAVVCLDFASLYPSLMRAYNLCTSTLLRDGDADLEGVTRVDVGGGRTVRFDTAGPEGVMPRILRVLLQRRKDVRAGMKALTGDAYRLANAKQLALKVCANSVYGVFGFAFFPIYMKDVAASVTSMGRESLRRVVALVESEGLRVVYGDTDSVFVEMRSAATDDAEAVAKDLGARGTALFPPPMELEYEQTFVRSIFLNKKRYAALLPDGKVYTKGLSTNRRDFPVFVQSVLRDALHSLLEGRDVVAVVSAHLTRLVSHEVQERDLTITKELRKPYDDASSLLRVITLNHQQGAYLWRGIAVTADFLRSWSGRNADAIVAAVTANPAVTLAPLLTNTYASLPPVAVLARRVRHTTPFDAPKVGDRIPFVVGRGGGSVSDRAVAPGEGAAPDLAYYAAQALDQVEDLMLNSGMEREYTAMRERALRDATNVRDRQTTIMSFFSKKAKT
jgi:DNA polymerase delta subunit 1